jgi:hypothetical protein
MGRLIVLIVLLAPGVGYARFPAQAVGIFTVIEV